MNIQVKFEFVPFEKLGSFAFGETENEFIKKYNIPYSENTGVNGKKIYEKAGLMFRFDQAALTQVTADNSLFISEITFNSTNINTIDGIKNLLSTGKYIESRAHYIFLELGVAISKDISKIKDVEWFFFDKSLCKYWLNIHRPVTSW